MPSVSDRITIAAPPERVFDFVADYRNAPRFMHEVEAFEPLGPITRGVGARVRVTARVMGIPVQTTLEITTYQRPTRLASRSYAGVEATATWQFVPQEDGTLVVFSSSYRLPALVRGPLKDRAMRAAAENVARTLRNLKHLLEGDAPPANLPRVP